MPKLKSLRTAAVGLIASAAIITAAYAAGLFPGFPIVGSPTYCTSIAGTGTGTGSATFNNPVNPQNFGQGTPGNTGSFAANCNAFAPAGPSTLTGLELIPADTQLASGQNPQTVLIPSGILGSSTNRLIGGDMTTNLAQRLNTTKGIAALAGLSPTAAVMTADRWWVIAPAAGVTVTIDSTASTAVIPGQNNTKALRVARTSSGAAGVVCVGQTLDKAASAPLIGNNAVFSFYEFNGATQSATNANITVNIDYTTAADTAGTQATLGFAGGNGSKFALGDAGQAGTPTNYTNAVAGASPGTTATVASGIATIAASTTWTRYSVYAPIPVNAPNTTTPVTSVSVSICWTPTATTAVATDYIELNFMQLEARPSTATANMPAGIISPSGVDRRLAAVEQLYQYAYLYFVYESQTLVAPVPFTSCTTTTSTTAGVCNVAFPTPMRIVPAVSFTNGFQLFTSTAYTTLGAAAGLAVYSNTVVTVASNTGFMMTATASTLPAVGTANFLMQLGTSSATGIISASAEP
jgi:hypothetical protein